jgi:hypothetical protein
MMEFLNAGQLRECRRECGDAGTGCRQFQSVTSIEICQISHAFPSSLGKSFSLLRMQIDAVAATSRTLQGRYKDLAATRGLEHFVVGSKPGTRVAAGCYHIQNVNSLHARYGKFIKPFCGPATKNLNGYIRWLEVRLAGVLPAEVVRAS